MARILICDDSMFMRMLLGKLLKEAGYEIVAEAGDGNQAVQLYQQYKPDLVTMDITMSHLDGIGAAKKIHEIDPSARVVMVTAIGQKQVIEDANQAGASGFIIKPFAPQEVLRVVKSALED
ncbi:response regulator [Acetonema longum]|uniref:Chemotaxis response regulator n=1 Tax=Acetonema longum DSM 6540 TaxID=1009370 RepID=F7NDU9_9FIRM|nr:response regulator [Acetonema longum]EGO65764.1 chemotaxis response regulator [Acetonema longum DSM 6540]